MKIPVFILTFNSQNKIKLLEGLDYYIIDNGNQDLSSLNIQNKYQTATNLGCAGGWNLICDIAFEYLGLDKIIISQDDVSLSLQDFTQCYNETDNTCITGAIQPFFEFSTFCITRDVWNTVGRFDENFIYVYSEDADYKHRCMLNNIFINSLYLDNKKHNSSSSISKDSQVNKISYNREYLYFKWGNSINPSPLARKDCQPPFENKYPYEKYTTDKFSTDFIMLSDRIKNIYGNITEFPSKLEYERFKNGHGFIR